MGKNMKFNTVEHVKSNLLIMLEAWKEEPRALMVDEEFKMSTRPENNYETSNARILSNFL